MSSPARILLLAVAVSLILTSLAGAHDPAENRIRELSTAIARDPANVDLVIERAEIYRNIGEYSNALAGFAQAGRMDRSRDTVLLSRAMTLCELGDFEQALVAVDAFLAKQPGQARAWRVRARCLSARRRVDDAIDALDRAIELANPPTPDDYIARARLLVSLGDSRIADAIAGLDEGLARLGPAASLQVVAIELEQQRGSYDAALARLDEIERKSGDSVAVLALADGADSEPARISTATPVVTRGPYLQAGADSRVVIRWRTDAASDSRVQYGAAPDALDQVVDDPALTTEHVVTLTALASDSRYYYSIGTATLVLRGEDFNHYFDTSPPVGSTPPVRVWVIGDSGTAGARAAGVRNAYRNHPGAADTDVWLMLGDNAYEQGTDAEYQAAVFDMYPTLLRNTVLWSTRGNHEVILAGLNNDYYDMFTFPTAGEAGGLASGTEAYYAFDYANVHFVCLDSQGSDRSPGGAMLTWLQQDLAATTQDWIIAFWHHPAYSKGSHDSDTELRLVEMRQNALPILEAAGVDLVLAGHSHSYERSCLLNGHYGLSTTLVPSMKVDSGDGRPAGDGAYQKLPSGPQVNNGAVYTVAGTSGSVSGGTYDHPVMISSLAELGSLVIDINNTELVATFIDTTGAALDSFVVSKADLPTTVNHPAMPQIHLSVQPNPFGAQATIEYAIPADRRVTLSIFDVRGQRVRSLINRDHTRGEYRAAWDGRDDDGRTVAQGIYFAVMKAGPERQTARLVLVR